MDGLLRQISTLTDARMLDAVRSSTFGGDGRALLCQPGTINAYQRALEPPGSWVCADDGVTLRAPDSVSERLRQWMLVHYEVPVLASLIYLAVVFGGRYLMNRTNAAPFRLRGLLVVWNAALAIFSAAGAAAVLPPLIEAASSSTSSSWLIDEVCTVRLEFNNLWVMLFALSKLPELIDTVFLVLRKRPVIFLHVYHHITVMLYCWDGMVVVAPVGTPFITMNLVVHAIMYAYYALAAAGVRAVHSLAVFITAMQLTQMIGGMFFLAVAINNCPTSFLASDLHIATSYTAGMAMYASYALLFLNFFIKRYSGSRPARPQLPDADKKAVKPVKAE